MATLNTEATSLRMYLNLGEIEGKLVEKTVSISGVKDSITGDQASAFVDAVTPLFEPAVNRTKRFSTALLVK